MILLGILMAALIIIVGYAYLHIIMAVMLTNEMLRTDKYLLGELEDGD